MEARLQNSREEVKTLLSEIHALVSRDFIQKRIHPFTIMEICGTHTMAIARGGLKRLLPEEIRLISGPGCPVCVSSEAFLAKALAAAERENTLLCTFGDMLRVPFGHTSLLKAKSRGAGIKLVYSPLEALDLALANPEKEVVFLAVGFETTAPISGAVVKKAAEQGIENFSLLCGHKTMPQALRTLFKGENQVDALLCPGHVATITGAAAWDFVSRELHLPAAIAGFEAAEILWAVLALLRQEEKGLCRTENLYPAWVRREGNLQAQALAEEIFTPSDALWRGLGEIPGSGLKLRDEYGAFDAEKRFSLQPGTGVSHEGCRCGDVLKGLLEPGDCPLMGKICQPQSPAGPCMVSQEGACAAYYQYERK